MHNLEVLLDKVPENVPFKRWKRVKVPEGEKEVYETKVIEQTATKANYIAEFTQEAMDFTEHVNRVRGQYSELRKLKENLAEHDVILQMDFAENFSCRSLDEVQTAFWNQSSVTVNPVVAYYRSDTKKPNTKQ